MNGFFSESALMESKAPPDRVPRCGACGLYRHCSSPKMPVDGEGRRKILIVGEAPGKDEDTQGIPFVGPTGRILQDTLRKFGIDLWRDCWLTNSARCRPKNNQLPEKAIEYCRPLVIQAINDLKPEVILLLGGAAVRSVIGWLWKEDPGGIGRWVGWRIPCQKLNSWVCPTWHPAALLHGQNERENIVRQKLFSEHLKAACELEGRPWGESPPDYKKKVRIIFPPGEAAYNIASLRQAGVPIAFDFETDRLKPDHPDARIVCCSVSDGRTAVAFPWHGAAITAMKELLTSSVPKIGYHMKFEDRWVRKHLGVHVRNWTFDGMLAAHVLDNRPGTKGLKFQSFVRLGQESYNDYIEPFLKGEGGNGPNRTKEVDMDGLLAYCGMDSLLEFKVVKWMAWELGVDLTGKS